MGGFNKEIKLPMEFAAGVNDYRDIIKELRKELRDLEADQRRYVRENKKHNQELEAQKVAVEARISHVRNLEQIKKRQDEAQSEMRQVYGAMSGQLSRLPVWAIADSSVGRVVGTIQTLQYYGASLAKSTVLEDAAKGTGLKATSAAIVQRMAGYAAGLGASAQAALTGAATASTIGIGGALTGAALYGAYYSAKTESLLNEGKMRDVLATIAISATRDAMSGGDRVSLATMQRQRFASETAANKMGEIYQQASGWERFREVIGLGASADTTQAKIDAAQHADKMFSIRNIYGESFYRKLVSPDIARAQIERRIDRERYGSEGYLRAAAWWAGAGWAGVFGDYKGWVKKQHAEARQEWQEKIMSSEAARREAEEIQYTHSIGRALDRVISNERRRRDAAIATESYARWNDWATQ